MQNIREDTDLQPQEQHIEHIRNGRTMNITKRQLYHTKTKCTRYDNYASTFDHLEDLDRAGRDICKYYINQIRLSTNETRRHIHQFEVLYIDHDKNLTFEDMSMARDVYAYSTAVMFDKNSWLNYMAIFVDKKSHVDEEIIVGFEFHTANNQYSRIIPVTQINRILSEADYHKYEFDFSSSNEYIISFFGEFSGNGNILRRIGVYTMHFNDLIHARYEPMFTLLDQLTQISQSTSFPKTYKHIDSPDEFIHKVDSHISLELAEYLKSYISRIVTHNESYHTSVAKKDLEINEEKKENQNMNKNHISNGNGNDANHDDNNKEEEYDQQNIDTSANKQEAAKRFTASMLYHLIGNPQMLWHVFTSIPKA